MKTVVESCKHGTKYCHIDHAEYSDECEALSPETGDWAAESEQDMWFENNWANRLWAD